MSIGGMMATDLSLLSGLKDRDVSNHGSAIGGAQKRQASDNTHGIVKKTKTSDCEFHCIPTKSSLPVSSPAPDSFDPDSLIKEPFYTISAKEMKEDGFASFSDFQLAPGSDSISIEECGRKTAVEVERRAGTSPCNNVTTLHRFEKAWGFVQGLRQLCNDLGGDFQKDMASFNSVFFLTENLLVAQDRMRSLGRNANVDIGYHYTTKHNLEKIKERGLLTKAERAAMGIYAKHNGSMYGDGVYLGNNPYAFMDNNFGNIGIVVARLCGERVSRGHRKPGWAENEDTRIAGVGFHEMVVLRESSQCIPLVDYDMRSMRMLDEEGMTSTATKLHDIHVRLQHIVDIFFNEGAQTIVPRVFPSGSCRFRARMKRRSRSSRPVPLFPANDPGFTRTSSPQLKNGPTAFPIIASAPTNGNLFPSKMSGNTRTSSPQLNSPTATPIIALTPSNDNDRQSDARAKPGEAKLECTISKHILAPPERSDDIHDSVLFDDDTLDILLNINTVA